MKKAALDALGEFVLSKAGVSLSEEQPKGASPQRILEIIWKMNSLFTPKLEMLKTVKYRSRHEASTDEAILKFAYNPTSITWEEESAGTWRVLLERQRQTLSVITANMVSGRDRFMSFPSKLLDTDLLGFVLIYMQYQMELPFPVDKLKSYELPEVTVEEYLQKH